SFGALSLMAGARYEYTDYDFRVDGRRDPEASRRDHLLTPDISLSYTFDEATSLNLSYRKVTVKPPYAQLTGSLTYTGPHEIEGGNPSLRDEHMNNLQLLATRGDFMLQCDFTRATDTYAFVKQLYPAPDLQLLMHPVNIDVSALSLYLMWGRPVGCWTPEATVGLYRQWLELDGARHNKPIFTYYFDNTVALPRGWTITANISGQSGGDMHTNRFASTPFTMDASLGKTFLNKALTVKLAATDIFGTACNDWTMRTCGIYVEKRQSYDRRGISLNLIYRFRPRRSAYKGSSASEAELRRL
ncbi:MAG: outer membrane beta-barrel family protein, partial [Muribaculaceae bacterium]|nr:outer membrane beta-barrel family protein [Muribaculaceae bacterium]